MSEQVPPGADPGREPTEDELRAVYEEQIKQLRIDDVVVNTIVSLINLAGRRVGIPEERDLAQVRMAVEAVRVLLPLVEDELGPDARPLRDALSQIQMAYAQVQAGTAPGMTPPEDAGEEPPEGGGDEPPPGPAPPESEQEPPRAGEPGPAQRSGRLWVPGQ